MSRDRLILLSTTAVGVLGAAAVCVGLVQLFKVGTCASGGPFLIARPCPSGTGAMVGLLGGGITVVVIACVVGAMSSPGVWQIPYSLLFLSAGITMAVDAVTAHGLLGGEKFGAWTIAAVFIPMGAWPPLAFAGVWAGGSEKRALDHHGVTATAILSEVRKLETYPTGEMKVELIYSVQAATTGSFPVSRVVNVVADQLPTRGQRVEIRYDPRHPEKFTLLGETPGVRVR